MTRARYTPEERRERYRHGGRISPANFANSPEKAVEAGRAGGFKSNFRTRGNAKAARAMVRNKGATTA